LPTICLARFLNFRLHPEILIFAVFYLSFEARKKKVSGLDGVIPWQDFLFLPDF